MTSLSVVYSTEYPIIENLLEITNGVCDCKGGEFSTSMYLATCMNMSRRFHESILYMLVLYILPKGG